MEKRLDKESFERIEGICVPIYTKISLNESIKCILNEMLKEGWDYTDVKDYIFDIAEDIINRDQENHDREMLARLSILGKQVVIIDETKTINNIFVRNIADFEIEGVIWFEEEKYGTTFAKDSEVKTFLEGKKAYIHPNEVSIQLVS